MNNREQLFKSSNLVLKQSQQRRLKRQFVVLLFATIVIALMTWF